jgi:hypothetical protein
MAAGAVAGDDDSVSYRIIRDGEGGGRIIAEPLNGRCCSCACWNIWARARARETRVADGRSRRIGGAKSRQ